MNRNDHLRVVPSQAGDDPLRPWLKSYQAGVPFDINIEPYRSINDFIAEIFSKYNKKPAFYCMGKTITFAELDQLSHQFASYLQNCTKLEPGDRLAVMLPNVLQYPIVLFGALKAGLIVVNVNPLYTARELEHQLKDSGAKGIVIFDNAAHLLNKIHVELDVILNTGVGDLLGFPKNIIVHGVQKFVKKTIPKYNLPRSVDLRLALLRGRKYGFNPVLTVTPDSIAFLQYTGGTTGVSKGAMLTHRNILSNMMQARAWISALTLQDQEIVITALPLYHIFSLLANCMVYMSLGALNVLIPNPRDLDSFVKTIGKFQITAITGVNTLFNALAHHPQFAKLDFSRLKVSLGGGMAVQKPVADLWKKVTGCILLEAYGLTETSPAACINPGSITEFNGFIGLPISSTYVAIKDESENDVPVNSVGEICIKGPQVMRGYWNRPDETGLVITKDGYFKTGDLGFMNEDGYVKIVDRKKDMILVSGFNVYPNEVEEVVAHHPKVFECAAIGVPDEKSGEVVKIFVVKKDPSVTEEEIIHFCREELTSYKVPKFVEFRDALPKSNVGKILRRELRPKTS